MDFDLRDPEVLMDVAGALAALPKGYRTVVSLHDIAGFTHEEIGTILGIEPGTSKSQLARAREHLRSRLAPPRKE